MPAPSPSRMWQVEGTWISPCFLSSFFFLEGDKDKTYPALRINVMKPTNCSDFSQGRVALNSLSTEIVYLCCCFIFIFKEEERCSVLPKDKYLVLSSTFTVLYFCLCSKLCLLTEDASCGVIFYPFSDRDNYLYV